VCDRIISRIEDRVKDLPSLLEASLMEEVEQTKDKTESSGQGPDGMKSQIE